MEYVPTFDGYLCRYTSPMDPLGRFVEDEKIWETHRTSQMNHEIVCYPVVVEHTGRGQCWRSMQKRKTNEQES